MNLLKKIQKVNCYLQNIMAILKSYYLNVRAGQISKSHLQNLKTKTNVNVTRVNRQKRQDKMMVNKLKVLISNK